MQKPHRSGSDSSLENLSDLSREALAERIRELEARLARAREASYLDELRTVKVPEPFEAPFLTAQRYVARYFAERVERPEAAAIEISGERYVLLRAASLSVEFIELVMSMYRDKGGDAARRVADNLLFDLAHAIGKADARCFQRKMNVTDPIECLSAGPIHFSFSGWAFVDISPESKPSPDENYFLLYDHPYSFESHSWLEKNQRSDRPVCIMNAGYSSGWCEESFGLPLVSVEIECMAAGDEHCRFIMAPPSRIEEHLARHAPESASSANGRRGTEVPEFFQRKRLEDELRQVNERLEQRVQERTRELEIANAQLRMLGSAVENAIEGIVTADYLADEQRLRVNFINRGFTQITGLESGDIIGQPLSSLRFAPASANVLEAMMEAVAAGRAFETEVTAMRGETPYALEIHVMPVDDGSDTKNHWIAILRDVSDRKAHLDALRRQALHDALTGLPNRVLLHDRIEQAVLATQRLDTQFALLFLDLDGFKEINDSFGHYTGDILLAKVSARLRSQVRATDTIARLGGDEFAVLLADVNGPDDAENLATQLLKALRRPFKVEEHRLVIGASIGIVICPQHGGDPTTLMRRADVAMYAAKNAQAGALLFHEQQDIHSPARIRLANDLRNCIDDQHLVLHYQPQIRIADHRTVRVEALLRWRHPDGQLLMPHEFLPLADGNELIDRLAHWAIETAIRDSAAWRREGLDVGVAVNLSPYNLRDTQLPGLVDGWLIDAKLPAEYLTLEITEGGILHDTVFAAGIFERLRDIGVGISIDDFGTGYSSLMHLRRLPFTELKIDRTFVRDLLIDEHDAAIVRSTIDLGQELGRTIVAEGVEDLGVLKKLEEFGCDYAQGYFISVPLERDALMDWLRAPPLFS